MISQAKFKGKLHSVKVSRKSPPVSHLMFVDELPIFCMANEDEASKLRRSLTLFANGSVNL